MSSDFYLVCKNCGGTIKQILGVWSCSGCGAKVTIQYKYKGEKDKSENLDLTKIYNILCEINFTLESLRGE